MRRAILGFLFSLWASVASAGINCSLPFTLVNGTTADASQVMANYNALVACLASAATAGANTDITSILGLTTPLNQASGGSPMFVGGTSTGSANAQAIASLVPANYTLTPKFFVAFIAGFSNSGPTTWNVNGTGAINVVAHTATGLSSLSGGELVAGQVTLGFYDGTQYQLLDAAPATGFVQPCTEIDYQGVATPSGYLAENGQLVARASFPNLFACMALSVAATTTSGSPTVAVPNSALVQVGWYVGGTNVVCNSQITGIPGGGLSITLNNNASGNGATTLSIGPQPQGDCSTTFNVPNMNGRIATGADPNGLALNATACANRATIGAPCGFTVASGQANTIQLTNLPPQTPSGNVSTVLNGTNGQLVQGATGGPVNIGGAGSGGTLVGPSPVSTFTGIAMAGQNSTPFLPQAIGITLKAIKF